MESNAIYSKEKNDAAISHLQEYFDGQELNLFERWHACECYATACLAAMSDHMQALCKKMKDDDIESIRIDAQ